MDFPDMDQEELRKAMAAGYASGADKPAPEAPAPQVGQGWQNPGVMLPQGFTPGGPVGKTLTNEMMKSPTAHDAHADFQKYLAQVSPRMMMDRATIDANPAPLGAVSGYGNMGLAGRVHDQALAAFTGLDAMAGRQEDTALKKYLGVGNLGNEAMRTGIMGGELGVRQRAQTEMERKGDFDRSEMGEVRRALADRYRATGEATPSSARDLAGAIAAARKETATGRQEGAATAGAAGAAGAAGGAAGGAQAPRDPAELYRGRWGTELYKLINSATSPDAAVQQMQTSRGQQYFGNKDDRDLLMQYLNDKFPTETSQYLRPSYLTMLGNRAKNIFFRPSATEVRRSMLANSLGLPTEGQMMNKPNEIGRGGPNRLAGGWGNLMGYLGMGGQ